MRKLGYLETVLADRPDVLWSLGEKNGTAARSLIAAANGTYTGGYTQGGLGPTVGEYQGSTLLDGSSGYVLLPSTNATLAIVGALTVECWVRHTAALTQGGWYGLYRRSGANDIPWALEVRKDLAGPCTLEFAQGSAAAGTEAWYTNESVPIDGKWHHVAVTRSGGAIGSLIFFYIDGQVLTLDTANSPSNVTTKVPVAGASQVGRLGAHDTGVEWVNGSMSFFALYSRALSKAQLLRHYQAGAGRLWTPGNPLRRAA